MQLAAYRNTERSARPAARMPTEEDRLASQVRFMERRKAELGAELTTLVKDREKAIKRLAYDRRKAQIELKAELERIAKELALADGAHKRRCEEMTAEMASISGDVKLYAIAKRICRAFGITTVAMCADRRDVTTTLARHAVCYWACRLTTKSTPQIGRFLGNRDHTTIMHGRDAYVQKRARMGRTLKPVK
jgi:chromosomal replication initiation ATPase DnaA